MLNAQVLLVSPVDQRRLRHDLPPPAAKSPRQSPVVDRNTEAAQWTVAEDTDAYNTYKNGANAAKARP